jgi:hypothetical protein
MVMDQTTQPENLVDRIMDLPEPDLPFTADDLEQNRAGKISRRQKARYIAARTVEHGIGALIVIFAFALIVHGISYAPSLEVIGAVVGVVFAVALVLLVLHIRPIFNAVPKKVSGVLYKDAFLPMGDYPFFGVTVGGVLFSVPLDLFDVLLPEGVYTVYYVERPPHVGGHTLLSVEPAP